MSLPPTVACVLVNWNNWQDTSACIAALALQDYPALRVIVVDNGFHERLPRAAPCRPSLGSPSSITAATPDSPKPATSAPAILRAADADFIWLLNNDTVAPSRHRPRSSSSKLKSYTSRQASVGAVLFYAHDATRIQAWGGGRISRWTAYNTHYTAPSSFGEGFLHHLRQRPHPPQDLRSTQRPIRRRLHVLRGRGLLPPRPTRPAGNSPSLPTLPILHKEGRAACRRAIFSATASSTLSGLTFLRRHAPIPAIACVLFLGSRVARRILHRDWPRAPGWF